MESTTENKRMGMATPKNFEITDEYLDDLWSKDLLWQMQQIRKAERNKPKLPQRDNIIHKIRKRHMPKTKRRDVLY